MCGSFHLRKKKQKNKRVCLGSYPHVNAHEKVNATSLTVVTATEERESWKWWGPPFTFCSVFLFGSNAFKKYFHVLFGLKREQKEKKTRKGKKAGHDCRKQNGCPPAARVPTPGSPLPAPGLKERPPENEHSCQGPAGLHKEIQHMCFSQRGIGKKR